MAPTNPPTPPGPDEQTVWKGTPSQIINLGTFVVCLFAIILFAGLFLFLNQPSVRWLLAGGMVIAFSIGFVRWLQTHCRVYEVTTQRIKTSNGVLSRRTDEFELYRVKDTTLFE